jgi:hypothetical protein
MQTIHVTGESNNSSQNPMEGTVFILALRKYRVNNKQCNPASGNMYGLMFFKKSGHQNHK